MVGRALRLLGWDQTCTFQGTAAAHPRAGRLEQAFEVTKVTEVTRSKNVAASGNRARALGLLPALPWSSPVWGQTHQEGRSP